MTPQTEFDRRLALVRQIAHQNSRRTLFSREEELQFIVAATLFTTAELHRLLNEAPAPESTPPRSRP